MTKNIKKPEIVRVEKFHKLKRGDLVELLETAGNQGIATNRINTAVIYKNYRQSRVISWDVRNESGLALHQLFPYDSLKIDEQGRIVTGITLVHLPSGMDHLDNQTPYNRLQKYGL